MKDKFERIHEEIKGYTQSSQPGVEHEMLPKPIVEDDEYRSAGKLKGKVALITGGDSGIGKATAILYAKEGANVAISYFDEDKDALETLERLKDIGVKVKAYKHDLKSEKDAYNLIENFDYWFFNRIAWSKAYKHDLKIENHAKELVNKVIENFGQINILVNNGGIQYPKNQFREITSEQLKLTFETNFFGMFYLTQAALPHLQKGDTIINTTSITAYNGSADLIDYSATKGAIVSFTRSLAQSLAKEGIRVNGVAPGPIYTPLIPATFDAEKVEKHGDSTLMGRRGQPSENAPAYVFLASRDSSYITGQVIHINGGDYISS